jgi:hypothetical protein
VRQAVAGAVADRLGHRRPFRFRDAAAVSRCGGDAHMVRQNAVVDNNRTHVMVMRVESLTAPPLGTARLAIVRHYLRTEIWDCARRGLLRLVPDLKKGSTLNVSP